METLHGHDRAGTDATASPESPVEDSAARKTIGLCSRISHALHSYLMPFILIGLTTLVNTAHLACVHWCGTPVTARVIAISEPDSEVTNVGDELTVIYLDAEPDSKAIYRFLMFMAA